MSTRPARWGAPGVSSLPSLAGLGWRLPHCVPVGVRVIDRGPDQDLCPICLLPVRSSHRDWLRLDPWIADYGAAQAAVRAANPDANVPLEDDVAAGLAKTVTTNANCGHRVHEACQAFRTLQKYTGDKKYEDEFEAHERYVCLLGSCRLGPERTTRRDGETGPLGRWPTPLSQDDRKELKTRIDDAKGAGTPDALIFDHLYSEEEKLVDQIEAAMAAAKATREAAPGASSEMVARAEEAEKEAAEAKAAAEAAAKEAAAQRLLAEQVRLVKDAELAQKDAKLSRAADTNRTLLANSARDGEALEEAKQKAAAEIEAVKQQKEVALERAREQALAEGRAEGREAGLRAARREAAKNALDDDNAEMLRLYVNGDEIDVAGDDGLTLLQRAVQRNKPNAVGMLINEGATAEGLELEGATLLAFAAREGHLQVLQHLVAVPGALLNGVDDQKSPAMEALTRALERNASQQVECVRVLQLRPGFKVPLRKDLEDLQARAGKRAAADVRNVVELLDELMEVYRQQDAKEQAEREAAAAKAKADARTKEELELEKQQTKAEKARRKRASQKASGQAKKADAKVVQDRMVAAILASDNVALTDEDLNEEGKDSEGKPLWRVALESNNLVAFARIVNSEAGKPDAALLGTKDEPLWVAVRCLNVDAMRLILDTTANGGKRLGSEAFMAAQASVDRSSLFLWKGLDRELRPFLDDRLIRVFDGVTKLQDALLSNEETWTALMPRDYRLNLAAASKHSPGIDTNFELAAKRISEILEVCRESGVWMRYYKDCLDAAKEKSPAGIRHAFRNGFASSAYKLYTEAEQFEDVDIIADNSISLVGTVVDDDFLEGFEVICNGPWQGRLDLDSVMIDAVFNTKDIVAAWLLQYYRGGQIKYTAVYNDSDSRFAVPQPPGVPDYGETLLTAYKRLSQPLSAARRKSLRGRGGSVDNIVVAFEEQTTAECVHARGEIPAYASFWDATEQIAKLLDTTYSTPLKKPSLFKWPGPSVLPEAAASDEARQTYLLLKLFPVMTSARLTPAVKTTVVDLATRAGATRSFRFKRKPKDNLTPPDLPDPVTWSWVTFADLAAMSVDVNALRKWDCTLPPGVVTRASQDSCNHLFYNLAIGAYGLVDAKADVRDTFLRFGECAEYLVGTTMSSGINVPTPMPKKSVRPTAVTIAIARESATTPSRRVILAKLETYATAEVLAAAEGAQTEGMARRPA